MLSVLHPRDYAELRVDLEARHAEEDLDAAVGEAPCPLDVVGLVEPCLELDDDGDPLAVPRSVDERVNYLAVLRDSVDVDLDGGDGRIIGCLAEQLGEVLEAVVRIVQENVALADGIEYVLVRVELVRAERCHRRVLELGAADVREGEEVLEVVVPCARQHGVVVADAELLPDEVEHVGRHVPVVGKPYRHGDKALLEALAHVVEDAAVKLGGEVVLGIAGHLHLIGADLLVVEEALEDGVEVDSDDVIEDDEAGPALGRLALRNGDDSRDVVGRDLDEGVEALVLAGHLDGEVGVLVLEEGYKVSGLGDDDRPDPAEYHGLEVLAAPVLLAVIDLLLVEEVDPLLAELLKEGCVGGVELVALHLGAVLHLGKELGCAGVAGAVVLIDDYASLEVCDADLEELVLVVRVDAEEADPFDKGHIRIESLLKNSVVE